MQTNTIAKKLRGRGSETLNHVGNSYRALFVTPSSTNAFHPEETPVKIIRDITEFGHNGMTDRDLVEQEVSEKRITGEVSEVALFPRDNGGRRLGIERRAFSYDIHLPERRSNKVRRSSVDRRNGVFSRMNARKWRDTERRAAFL